MNDHVNIFTQWNKKISVYFILYYFGNFVKWFLNFLGWGIEKMNFSEKIKIFRIQNGYTQEEFARLIGAERSSISRYESGETAPDVYKAVKIATLMGTTCEELVSTENYGQI